MMTPIRKTIPGITARALRKCTQFYKDGVHVKCTPAEFLALCWHFDAKPYNMDYYIGKVAKGECNVTNHYIHVKKWTQVFPVDKYALLEYNISL